jgi:transposase
MLPTKKQELELKNCIGVAREAFNFANRRVRDDKASANRIALRNEWEKLDHPPKVKAVARRFARGAIYDLVDAYKSNYAKCKANPKHRFEVRDRDEFETRTESLQVERKGVLLEVIPVESSPEWVQQRKRHEKEDRERGVLSSTPVRQPGSWRKRRSECLLRFGNTLGVHGPIRIQGRQRTINAIVLAGKDLQAAARIQWNKHADAFYFIWCFELPALQDPDPAFNHKTIVALDPGCAPFQKWYSPTSGKHGELLSDGRLDLKLHCLKIDHTRQRIGKRLGNPQRYSSGRRVYSKRKRQRLTRSLRKKLRRECRRLSGYMESGHYDAANFLLRHHDIVIAPILATTRLTDKSTRCFGSRLARSMYTWSHRLFRQRLAFAAARYPGRHVFECVEPGTSKTCTSCGWWNKDLKLGDKVCRCPRCSIVVDRQLTGARNNFFAAYGMAMGVGWDGVGG